MLRTVAGPLSEGPAAFPAPAPYRGQADELVWDDLCFAVPAAHRPLFLDLHVPRPEAPVPGEAADTRGRPVIVWVHGGGWEAGSRRRLGGELQSGWIIERMVLAGFAVALVDYRLTAEATFPAPADDVRAAVAWLAGHRDDFGLDTTRLALWGESAGAHLALIVGATAAAGIGEARVRAVVDWYGPVDLPALYAGGGNGALSGTWASPAASPVNVITAAMPPTLIVHGRDDDLVPPAQSRQLHELLDWLGVVNEHVESEGGHVFVGADVVPAMTNRTLDFLCTHLGHTRGPRPDPEVAMRAARLREEGVRGPFETDDPHEARRRVFDYRKELNAVDYGVASVEDVEIHTGVLRIPVRVQTPVAPTRTVVLYVHGGGWVTGDLDSHEKVAARIAQSTPATVIQLDYRRAPEHPFPAAHDDVVAATAWVAARLDEYGADTLVLAGDSAGGGLAVAAALWARDNGVRVDALLLNHPAVDWTSSSRAGLPHTYFGGDDSLRLDPRVSPALADLRGLPPVFCGVGGLDRALEDVLRFAHSLREADVPVTMRIFPRLQHGYFGQAAISRGADRAAEQMCRDLSEFTWNREPR